MRNYNSKVVLQKQANARNYTTLKIKKNPKDLKTFKKTHTLTHLSVDRKDTGEETSACNNVTNNKLGKKQIIYSETFK